MKYSDFLKNLAECPFCAAENASNRKLVENSLTYLTFSIAPYHKDHLLAVPKRHITDLLELTPDEQKDLDDIQSQGIKILNKMGYKNISVLVREGGDSGKSIEHSHYHLIPEVLVDRVDSLGINREVMSETEIEELVKRVKAIS